MPPRALDWEAVHRRLAATAEAIARGIEPSPEEVRRVLEARARVAARPPAVAEEAALLEVLAFSLAGERYAIASRYVAEVSRLTDLTPLPCVPSFVAGVMGLRGRILAVLDLRLLFGLPPRGLTELDRVLVVSGAGRELGLLADAVDGLRSVRTAALQEGLPTLTGVRERFLLGVTGDLVAVLDGQRLLDAPTLRVDEQVSR
ncbi:MAG: chemotaxis protein CheW [Pseudomonadota bacterium]